jgi:hypothetical protein
MRSEHTLPCVPEKDETVYVPLTNEKQLISPPANERQALTALWSNQKENQETVTVMEQGDCVSLANEKQDNSPPANERQGLTALWSNQKENQERVTVMEQRTWTVFL